MAGWRLVRVLPSASFRYRKANLISGASRGSCGNAVHLDAPQSLCLAPLSRNVREKGLPQSLYRRLIAFPAVQDYLRAFPEATNVSLKIVPARTYTPFLIAVPVCLDGRAVAYLVANLTEQDFTARRRRAVRQLLRLFARNLSELAPRWLAIPCSNVPPCVLRADEYIRSHFHDPIYITEVARRVGFCTDHFGRVFRRAMGVTFTNYLTHVRVEKAKELLATTQRRVSEVAFACGFESIPHFNRAFKCQTNQAPCAYRAAHACGPGSDVVPLTAPSSSLSGQKKVG
jgi:AraC-like DNA-binding protein